MGLAGLIILRCYGFGRPSKEPSEGIFYVVPTPRGWNVYSHRFDVLPECHYSTIWNKDAAPALATYWTKMLSRPASDILCTIINHPYGFPRGRVVKVGKSYNVYHANDIPKFMKVSKLNIENCFSIRKKSKWILDPKVQCMESDRDMLRLAFNLKETWPAASEL